MSNFQHYEFMTIDKPLTQAQLEEVKKLSSHIEASSTHALIEYQWGDFKHDPMQVLYKFFDGFLYWANWGSPRLGLRFPHGILSATLINDYDLEDYVTFATHPDYDILDINFGDTDAPDEWIEYELSSLIAIRNELIEADLRALYITWLASQCILEGYENEVIEEDYEIKVPSVPRGLISLSSAESVLADLLQVPQDLLSAAANHSKPLQSETEANFATWIKLLSPNHRDDYLIRLARNEPGLSSLLVRELRELNPDTAKLFGQKDEYITYAKLNAESKKIRNK
ncbi:MAG TPA: hypothetical protein VMR41_03340 [Patescibacteria group bacterium]|nr:hypothetical protein [Patescibacteria group bacterium]